MKQINNQVMRPFIRYKDSKNNRTYIINNGKQINISSDIAQIKRVLKFKKKRRRFNAMKQAAIEIKKQKIEDFQQQQRVFQYLYPTIRDTQNYSEDIQRQAMRNEIRRLELLNQQQTQFGEVDSQQYDNVKKIAGQEQFDNQVKLGKDMLQQDQDSFQIQASRVIPYNSDEDEKDSQTEKMKQGEKLQDDQKSTIQVKTMKSKLKGKINEIKDQIQQVYNSVEEDAQKHQTIDLQSTPQSAIHMKRDVKEKINSIKKETQQVAEVIGEEIKKIKGKKKDTQKENKIQKELRQAAQQKGQTKINFLPKPRQAYVFKKQNDTIEESKDEHHREDDSVHTNRVMNMQIEFDKLRQLRNEEIQDAKKQGKTKKERKSIYNKYNDMRNRIMKDYEDNVPLNIKQKLVLSPKFDVNSDSDSGAGAQRSKGVFGYQIDMFLKDDPEYVGLTDLRHLNQKSSKINLKQDGYIVILDNHHYTTIFIDNQLKNIIYYDSLGRQVPNQVKQFAFKLMNQIAPEVHYKFKYNANKIQMVGDPNCALYCIDFVDKYQNTKNFAYASQYMENMLQNRKDKKILRKAIFPLI